MPGVTRRDRVSMIACLSIVDMGPLRRELGETDVTSTLLAGAGPRGAARGGVNLAALPREPPERGRESPLWINGHGSLSMYLLECVEMCVVAGDVDRPVLRDRRRRVDVAGECEQPQERSVGRDRVEMFVFGTDEDGAVGGDAGGRDDLVGGGDLPADLAGGCDGVD